MVGPDWYARAQDRHEAEQRGHLEAQDERDARYWDTHDRIAEQSPASSTGAELHRATRDALGLPHPVRAPRRAPTE